MDPLQSQASLTDATDASAHRHGLASSRKPVLITMLLIVAAATGAALLISLGIQGAAEQLQDGFMAVMLGEVGYKALDRLEQNRVERSGHSLNDFMRSIAIYGLATAVFIVQVLSILASHRLGHG